MKRLLWLLASVMVVIMLSCSKDSENEDTPLVGTKWVFSYYNNNEITIGIIEFISDSRISVVSEDVHYENNKLVHEYDQERLAYTQESNGISIKYTYETNGKIKEEELNAVVYQDYILMSDGDGSFFKLVKLESNANPLIGTLWSATESDAGETFNWCIAFLPDDKLVLCEAHGSEDYVFNTVEPGLYKYDSSEIKIVLDSEWTSNWIDFSGNVIGSNLILTDTFDKYWQSSQTLNFKKF